MQVKIHRSYRKVVTICDSDLIGKKFEEDKFQLDCKASFYKDQEISKQDLILLIQRQAKEDATFNIVGEESVQTAIEAGLLNENQIGNISGIPYALTFI